MPNNISASAQVTLLDPLHFLVFSLEDNSSPGVSLESIAPPQPYGNPIEVTFTYSCTNNHLYTVKVWESVDSTPTGVVRCSYSRAISNTSINFRSPIYAQVDVTPLWVSGQPTLDDASFTGWVIDTLWRKTDYLIPSDAPDNNAPDYDRTATGFTLLNGFNLEPGEQWKVDFEPQIIVAQPGVPSPVFATGQIITVDTALTGSEAGQALSLQSATNKLTVRLPLLSSVAAFTWFYIYSEGGSHINATIETSGSDRIMYNGLNSQLWLAQHEIIKVFKAPFGASSANVWYVDNILEGVKEVGHLIHSFSTAPVNTVFCNGQILDRTVYPRLWSYVQSLPAGLLVSDATWNTPSTINGQTIYTNKGKFSSGDGSTTFRVPLLTTYMLRPVDGSSRLAGNFEYQDYVAHRHLNGIVDDAPSLFVYTATSEDLPGNATRTIVSEGLAVNYQGTTSTEGGPDNKPNTIGVYIAIKY